jgi:hypothetical protein
MVGFFMVGFFAILMIAHQPTHELEKDAGRHESAPS